MCSTNVLSPSNPRRGQVQGIGREVWLGLFNVLAFVGMILVAVIFAIAPVLLFGRWCFGRGRSFARFLFRREPHVNALGQVHETHRKLLTEGELDGLPLRREHCKGIVDGALRLFRVVNEQRDRRLHLGVKGQRQYALGIRWSLDEDAIRLHRLQRAPQAPRRTGSMVPDAKYLEGGGGHV
jgi:hypothetical protein